jgi:hypothetical protein
LEEEEEDGGSDDEEGEESEGDVLNVPIALSAQA